MDQYRNPFRTSRYYGYGNHNDDLQVGYPYETLHDGFILNVLFVITEGRQELTLIIIIIPFHKALISSLKLG